jgi:hypothetical protein
MDTIAGMQRTGRRIPGPGADLVEVVDASGLKQTAVVFAPVFRDHACLNAELEVGMGFMEQPGVTGLSRLVGHHPDEGAFVYPTGTVWSVAELVRELADQGDSAGVKAGLELCFMAGEILVEASDQGTHSGLVGHGSIDPWRVMVKADGQVTILGYGLPRPEIEIFVEDETRAPSEDGLRYLAPENLAPERIHDLSSDLFSLCLVALELMMGRPVYDGLVNEVRKQASRGEAVRRLYQWRDRIPESVRDVIGKALKPDPDIRFRDGLDFVYSVHDLLSGIDAGDGPSLREIVTQVRNRQKRGKAVVGGNTGSLTRAEIAALAADIDAEGVGTDLPAPRKPRPAEGASDGAEQPRWRRSTRSAANTSTPPVPATPAPAAEPARSRGAARVRGAEPAAPVVAAPPARTGGEDPSARDRLLRRLRERDDSAQRRRRPGDEPPGPAADAPSTQAVRTPTEDARPSDTDARPTTERRRRSRPPDEAPEPAVSPQSPREPAVQAPPVQVAPVQAAPAPSPGPSTSTAPAPLPTPTLAPVDDDAALGPSADPPTRSRGGRAAALLERLRSTSGSKTREEPRARTRSSDTTGPIEPTPALSAPMPIPAPVPAPAPVAVSAAVPPAPSVPAPASSPIVAAAQVAGARPEPIDARPTPAPAPTFDDASEDATAAIDVAGLRARALAENSVRVAFGGRSVSVRREGTAGRVAELAAEALELATTDLLGARVASFRLVAGDTGAPIGRHQPSTSLDGEFVLERVRNQIVFAVVESPGDPAVRVKTPLGTAVPVAHLKRGLRELLALDGAFELAVGGKVLQADAMLADLGLDAMTSEPPVIRVTR